jgi:3-oxoacyl-(acyl-carrier-protein) synthase
MIGWLKRKPEPATANEVTAMTRHIFEGFVSQAGYTGHSGAEATAQIVTAWLAVRHGFPPPMDPKAVKEVSDNLRRIVEARAKAGAT